MSVYGQDKQSSFVHQSSDSQESGVSKNAQPIEWVTNEPINPLESPDIKTVILKVESLNNQDHSTKSVTSLKSNNKALKQVCKLFGLNHNSPLLLMKEEMQQKLSKFACDVPNLHSPRVTTCTSIFITQMPLWFKYFHVKAVIQLKSEFDVDSDSYYIDMFKDSDNKHTGKCLLRFMENKDCLQVYKDLHGIELNEVKLLVELDLDHEIADERDRCNPKFEEQLCKYNETRARHRQNLAQDIKRDKDDSIPPAKKEVFAIKTELLDNSNEFENNENTLGIKCEVLDCDSRDGMSSSDSTVILAQTDSNQDFTEGSTQVQTNLTCQFNETNVNIADETSVDNCTQNEENANFDTNLRFQNDLFEYTDEHQASDTDFDQCRIVHVKNIPPSKTFSCMSVIKVLLREKICNNMVQYSPVIGDDKTITKDILIQLESHKSAVAASKLLDGVTVLGEKLEASLGVGYSFKKSLSINDLMNFQRKRKMLSSKEHEKETPSKRPRIEDSTHTHTPTNRPVNYDFGFMPPEILYDDAFGLSNEFMRILGINTPLTRRIIVSHLHPEVNEAKLLEVFSLAGEVKKININAALNDTLQAKIEYDHPLEAVQAISMLHKHNLYSEPMNVRMDCSKKEQPLPLGLSSVGKGLGFNGEPLRGLRIKAEMRTIYESLTDLGAMERILKTKPASKKSKWKSPAVITPFKFDYKKRKPKRLGVNWTPTKDTSASNDQNSTWYFQSSAPDIQNSTPNIQNSCYLAQNSYPTQNHPSSLKNILATLPNPASSTPVSVPNYSNMPTTAPGAAHNNNRWDQAPKVDPLNEAITRVMEFMTPNTVTLNMVQSNTAQHFQGTAVTIPPRVVSANLQVGASPAQTTSSVVPRPGCSNEKDKVSQHSKCSRKKDIKNRKDGIEKSEKDSPHRSSNLDREYCYEWRSAVIEPPPPLSLRHGSAERDSHQRSVERDSRNRRNSVEKDSHRRSVERDSRSKRYSVERDSQNRRNSLERPKDPDYKTHSLEKDFSQRRNSVDKEHHRKSGAEKKICPRRAKLEKEQQRLSSEEKKSSDGRSLDKEFYPRRSSIEKDSNHRRHIHEEHSIRSRYSGERESRYRRGSEERYFRSRDREVDDHRHSRHSEERLRDSLERDHSKQSPMLVFNNLPPHVTSSGLSNKLSQVGSVEACEVGGGGRAFVRFRDHSSSRIALELFHLAKLDLHVIEVDYL